MTEAQPETKRGRTGKAVSTLLLAASVLALLRPMPLQAQETELRGEVSESAILSDQQRKVRQMSRARAQDQNTPQTATADAPADAYSPASSGAVPDDTDAAAPDESIFEQPAATDDPFADNPAPPKPRRTPTARQRADATGKMADDKDTAKKNKTNAADKKKTKQQTDATTTRATADDTGLTAEDQDGANRRAVTVDSVDRQKLDPGAERTASIEGQKNKPEDDPFAATGIKVGTFVFKPTVEQGLTATSNADASSGGKSALLSETALRFTAASDWRENSATIDGYGIFRNTVSGRRSTMRKAASKASSTSTSTTSCAPSPSSATRRCLNQPPRRMPSPASPRSRCDRPSTAASPSRRMPARCATR